MLNVNPGRFEVNKDCPLGAMELPCRPGTWMEANLNVTDDYSLCCNRKSTWDELQADRMVINLGVWTANDGPDQPFAIYFTDLQLEEGENVKSHVTNLPISKMPDEKIWWLGKFEKFIHIAGEHRYLTATKFTKT
jgi:hypothetical protein